MTHHLWWLLCVKHETQSDIWMSLKKVESYLKFVFLYICRFTKAFIRRSFGSQISQCEAQTGKQPKCTGLQLWWTSEFGYSWCWTCTRKTVPSFVCAYSCLSSRSAVNESWMYLHWQMQKHVQACFERSAFLSNWLCCQVSLWS